MFTGEISKELCQRRALRRTPQNYAGSGNTQKEAIASRQYNQEVERVERSYLGHECMKEDLFSEELESLPEQGLSACFVGNAFRCPGADAGPADYLQRSEH